MARLIPPYIDESFISSAEQKIFQMFHDSDPARDWTVLHSLGLANRGRIPYGEIEFVVLIPSFGCLCLEVKGGRVSCHDGIWTTVDRGGKSARLKKSPFIQARGGMFAFRNKVIESINPKSLLHDFVIGSAVVFPDVEFTIDTIE